ncbi:hypothetical protein AB1L42_17315 [Thalassoglobus sp. JC818]|uniref:hypothetical protein n=1 Tax=Thalassoglobus sp. JC818 TaxID=3232136 RepID=UPI003459F4D5
MSATLESSNGHLPPGTSAFEPADGEWLQSISFRGGATRGLGNAAKKGDLEEFSRIMKEDLLSLAMKKRERKELQKDLRTLWPNASTSDEPEGAWERILFGKLKRKSEVAAEIHARIAENLDSDTNFQSLCSAIWILSLKVDVLSTEALIDLWRWVVQQGQSWLENKPEVDPDQALSQLPFLETVFMLAVSLRDLKGAKKLQKEVVGLIRMCIDETSDNDGTPQPQWIPGIVDSLCCLARMSLFARVHGERLWNESILTRLHSLLERVISLCTPNRIAFSGAEREGDVREDFIRLRTVLAAVDYQDGEGLDRYLKGLAIGKSLSAIRSEWELPEETFQSDWAMVANLRSSWKSPIDQCVVIHDSKTLSLDVVAADIPIFRGKWEADLQVDGKSVESDEQWTCTCWFEDAEVDFMELVQDGPDGTKLMRQVILLRQDHQLILNQSVRANEAKSLAFRSTIPIAASYEVEADSATREVALLAQGQRIRVLPISVPQERTQKALGFASVEEGKLVVEQSSEASRLFVSTVFDWAPKRHFRPVEWNQLTVVQDGKIESQQDAFGARFRIGRNQWLMYHSLEEPNIPRTVLGMHTNYETSFSRFTSKGEIDPIVEVEID